MLKRLLTGAVATCLVAAPAAAGWLNPGNSRVRHSLAKLGRWQLVVATNEFTGQVACRLRSRDGKAIYQAHAVGFKLQTDLDTSRAAYRLDGGPARFGRDDLPELVVHGAPIDRGPMGNPSLGMVWIPFERLIGARTVAIQLQPGAPIRSVKIDGLKDMYDLAVSRGCVPDRRFVER